VIFRAVGLTDRAEFGRRGAKFREFGRIWPPGARISAESAAIRPGPATHGGGVLGRFWYAAGRRAIARAGGGLAGPARAATDTGGRGCGEPMLGRRCRVPMPFLSRPGTFRGRRGDGRADIGDIRTQSP